MNRRTIFAGILISALVPNLAAEETKAPAQGPAPAASANAIAFSFYSKEAAKPGNVFFSPYSIRTAFAMAYAGARGKTKEEIASVFSFPA
ncbi:MAG: serpin family protein, partial [Elusimicrobiota bacterium]